MGRDTLICWILLALLAPAILLADAHAASTSDAVSPTPEVLFAKAEQVRTSDHPLFARILTELHAIEARLTPHQRWHLMLLDAQHLCFTERREQSIPALHDIIAHSGDAALIARARTQLIMNDFLAHRYQQAYEQANTLMKGLPKISDPIARLSALSTIVQLLNSVGQHDLALTYARQIKVRPGAGKARCERDLAESQTLLYAGKATPDSPGLHETINSCLAAHEIVAADALRLDIADVLVEDGRAREAIAMLQRIAPDIEAADYQFHVASLRVALAQAYEKLGELDKAHRFALAALKANAPDAANWTVQEANKLLYRLEKKLGHPAAALAYHEKFAALSQASADDARQRALAYQMVKQDVMAQKQSLEDLDRQNRILQLRQTVAEQETETGHLYIALLLVIIASTAFWLYRIKHAQIRFRRLAQHDGMTGTLNRKHFLEVAGKALDRLQRSNDGACLVLLDLDHFKQVNDRYGHAAGDDVLTRTVAICRKDLRESDVFGRLGGEEFGILMPYSTCEQGEEVANRIRSTLASARIFLASGDVVRVSASFGLACSRTSGYDLPHLLGVA
ncbi:MAG: diguanylate cyclase, partial [Rhodanobacteraceae bacterium]